MPSYPDTAPGLEKFLGQMVELAKSLTLPNRDAWYQAAFGEHLGAAYAAATEQGRRAVGNSIPATLATLECTRGEPLKWQT